MDILKKLLNKKYLRYKGEAGSGTVFVVIVVLMMVAVAFTFIGGKMPQLDNSKIGSQVVLVTSSPQDGKQNLQLYTFIGLSITPSPTPTPNPTLPPESNPVTTPVPTCPVTAAAVQAKATVLWDGSFHGDEKRVGSGVGDNTFNDPSGNYDTYSCLPQPDSFQLVQNPHGRQGWGAKFYGGISPNYDACYGQKDMILAKYSIMKSIPVSGEYWYGWSEYLTPPFSPVGGYPLLNVGMSMVTQHFPVNPPIHSGIGNGNYKSSWKMTVSHAQIINGVPQSKSYDWNTDLKDLSGKWIDVMMHVKWSWDNTGFFEYYVKTPEDTTYKKVASDYNIRNLIDVGVTPFYLSARIGQYRSNKIENPTEIMYMNPKIGTTMADVTYGGTTTPDTEKPTVSITCPSGTNLTYDSPLTTLSGTASDNVGISKVEVKVNSGLWITTTGTTSWVINLTGVTARTTPHTISIRATDAAGNISDVKTINVTIGSGSDSGSGSSADLLFDGTFKSTDSVNYTGLPNRPNLGKFTGYSCVPRSDSLALVDASTLSGGRIGWAAKFTIGVGSAYNCNGNQHDQITTFDPHIPTTATDVWYGWTQRVTSNWHGSYAFGMTEGYQFPCDLCGSSGFGIGTNSSGRIEIKNNCQKYATASCSWQMDTKYNFQPNVWEDWMYHIKWARDNTGLVEIYKNGVLAWSKYNYPTRTTLYDYNDHRLGIYRASTETIPYTMYIMNPKIGLTKASVTSPRLHRSRSPGVSLMTQQCRI